MDGERDKGKIKANKIPTQFRVTSRVSHFAGDFVGARSLRGLRTHFQREHGLTNVHAAALALTISKKCNELPVPLPYRSVIACVSRLVPSSGEVEQGGESFYGTWTDPESRFQIGVHWPVALRREMEDGRLQERCARLLLHFTKSFLCQQAKVKPAEIRTRKHAAIDKALLNRLLRVRVEVCNLAPEVHVSGFLIRLCGRGRFVLPLLKALQIAPVLTERVPVSQFTPRSALELRDALTSAKVSALHRTNEKV